MNKTFRTLWNQALGCYVACHEKATSQGKSSSTKALKNLLLASIFGCFQPFAAYAGTLVDPTVTVSSQTPGATNQTMTISFTTATELDGAQPNSVVYSGRTYTSYGRSLIRLRLPNFTLPTPNSYVDNCPDWLTIKLNGVVTANSYFKFKLCGKAPETQNYLVLAMSPVYNDSSNSDLSPVIPAGTKVDLIISGVTIPNTLGTISQFATTDNGGETIDAASPIPTIAYAAPNAAPTATPSIAGTVAVGQTLTGSYTYSDTEEDGEDTGTGGTSFKWKRNSSHTANDATAITGADGDTTGSNQSYIPAAADLGNYLFYCVTPKASTGTAAGAESCSAAIGPVTGGTLTNVSASASSTRTSASNVTYSVNFTTATAIPAMNFLLNAYFPDGVEFPAMNDVNDCTGKVSLSLDGVPQTLSSVAAACLSFNAGSSKNGLQINNTNAIPANTQVSIQITGASNPSSAGASSFSLFKTALGSGASIDEPATLPSITYTTVSAPGKPLSVSATAGNQQATVSFANPASDDGSSISNYLAVCEPENNFASISYPHATGTTSPITVPGMTNGTAYLCYVQAQNEQGWGTRSDLSSTITPTAPVEPPPAPAGPPAPPSNPFTPGGTSTVNVITSTGGTSTSYTQATNDLVTNLGNLNNQVGIADNGVLVVLDNGIKEPVKFKDNPPDNVLIAMPSQKPVGVVLNGNTINVTVDQEGSKPTTPTVLGTTTLALSDGTQAKGLQVVQGQAQMGSSVPNGVLGGLELSKDTTLRGVTAQAGGSGGTAGFLKNADTSGAISADAGEVVISVRLKVSQPQGAKVNALAATDTVTLTLQAGEVARFDAKGELIGVYAGSLSGKVGKTGDLLAIAAPAGLTGYPSKVVKLDGSNLARLGGNLLPAFAGVIGNTSNFASDTATTALVQDSATGIVTAKNANRAELSYYGLPVGEVTINPATPDGIVWQTNGTVVWTVKGVSVTFAPVVASLGDLAASAKSLGYSAQVLDTGAVKLAGSANYLVGLPRFLAQPQGLSAGFAWDAKTQRATFTDAQGNTQIIDPVPLDGAQLDKATAVSPGWSLERDYFLYGAIRLKGPNGENFNLTPDYSVTLDTSTGNAAAYNGSDGRLYFRYNSGFLPFSQGFTTK